MWARGLWGFLGRRDGEAQGRVRRPPRPPAPRGCPSPCFTDGACRWEGISLWCPWFQVIAHPAPPHCLLGPSAAAWFLPSSCFGTGPHEIGPRARLLPPGSLKSALLRRRSSEPGALGETGRPPGHRGAGGAAPASASVTPAGPSLGTAPCRPETPARTPSLGKAPPALGCSASAPGQRLLGPGGASCSTRPRWRQATGRLLGIRRGRSSSQTVCQQLPPPGGPDVLTQQLPPARHAQPPRAGRAARLCPGPGAQLQPQESFVRRRRRRRARLGTPGPAAPHVLCFCLSSWRFGRCWEVCSDRALVLLHWETEAWKEVGLPQATWHVRSHGRGQPRGSPPVGPPLSSVVSSRWTGP